MSVHEEVENCWTYNVGQDANLLGVSDCHLLAAFGTTLSVRFLSLLVHAEASPAFQDLLQASRRQQYDFRHVQVRVRAWLILRYAGYAAVRLLLV